MSITGDIKSTPTTLTIAGHKLELRLVRQLNHDDTANAAALLDTKITPNLIGVLYQTHLSAGTKLQGNNTLCGKNDTTWIVILLSQSNAPRSTADLYLANFSGSGEPDLRPSAIATSTHLCGTYWYEKSSST